MKTTLIIAAMLILVVLEGALICMLVGMVKKTLKNRKNNPQNEKRP
jgi:uncharacterized protein YjeT (DUF2065 family)